MKWIPIKLKLFLSMSLFDPFRMSLFMMQCISAMLDSSVTENSALISELDNNSHCQEEQDEDIMGETDHAAGSSSVC